MKHNLLAIFLQPFVSVLRIAHAGNSVGAENIFLMVIPAVNFDHLMDDLGFSSDAIVHELRSAVLKMSDKHERKSWKIHA